MTKSKVDRLIPGIYILYWKEGGASFAAVGITESGKHWVAPYNWVCPAVNDAEIDKTWKMVETVCQTVKD